MKNRPSFPLFDIMERCMFVDDKQGRTLFFPWGDKKPGYILKDESDKAKIRNFFVVSFSLSLVFIGMGTSLTNPWAIFSAPVIGLVGWCLAYWVYVSRITRHLRRAKTSYGETVLQRIAAETEKKGKSTP